MLFAVKRVIAPSRIRYSHGRTVSIRGSHADESLDSNRVHALQPDVVEYRCSSRSVGPLSCRGHVDLDGPPELKPRVYSCAHPPLPEYRNKTLTKLAGGNPRLGCYGLAVTIFALGILRDHLYAA